MRPSGQALTILLLGSAPLVGCSDAPPEPRPTPTPQTLAEALNAARICVTEMATAVMVLHLGPTRAG